MPSPLESKYRKAADANSVRRRLTVWRPERLKELMNAIAEIAKRQSVVEALLRCYKQWGSPLFGSSCRFGPSCSEYTAQAVVELGWWRGGALAIKRVLRCHPLGASGYDPVPQGSCREQLRP